MKGYLKLLPLCLVIGSCTVFASETDDHIIKAIKQYDTLDDMRSTTAINNKNAYVNLEIHEVIINNVDKPFNTVNDFVKVTDNPVELDRYFQTLGSIQSSSTFNFNGVPNNRETFFENSYTKRHLVKNNNQATKKNEAGINYNNGESSNSYTLNVGLKQLMNGSIELHINGKFDSDYVVSDSSSKNDRGVERTQSNNIVNQTSIVKMNEYAIISNDTKSSGADNKTREDRFFIVKITESPAAQ